MFHVYSIFAGWMSISFGDDKIFTGVDSEDREIFHLSYLDQVKEDLDCLFNLSYTDDKETKEKVFDLEGEELLIKTYLYGDIIHIFCSYLSSEELKDYHYVFDYKEFIKDYVSIMTPLEKSYMKDFAYNEEDFIWETNDWKELKNKIKKLD